MPSLILATLHPDSGNFTPDYLLPSGKVLLIIIQLSHTMHNLLFFKNIHLLQSVRDRVKEATHLFQKPPRPCKSYCN